jgi:hypothetical protein
LSPQNTFTGRTDFIQVFLNAEVDKTVDTELTMNAFGREELKNVKIEKALTMDVK